MGDFRPVNAVYQAIPRHIHWGIAKALPGQREMPGHSRLVFIQIQFRHRVEDPMPPARPVVRDVGCYSRHPFLVFVHPLPGRRLRLRPGNGEGKVTCGADVCSCQRETGAPAQWIAGKPVASLRNENGFNSKWQFEPIHPDFAQPRLCPTHGE